MLDLGECQFSFPPPVEPLLRRWGMTSHSGFGRICDTRGIQSSRMGNVSTLSLFTRGTWVVLTLFYLYAMLRAQSQRITRDSRRLQWAVMVTVSWVYVRGKYRFHISQKSFTLIIRKTNLMRKTSLYKCVWVNNSASPLPGTGNPCSW